MLDVIVMPLSSMTKLLNQGSLATGQVLRSVGSHTLPCNQVLIAASLCRHEPSQVTVVSDVPAELVAVSVNDPDPRNPRLVVE